MRGGRKSRQLIDRDIHDGKLPNGYGFCRKCQTIKTEVMFSKSTENTLDSNGLLSVCKSCVDDIYLNVLESENGNIAKTILTLCRMLNVRFEQSAIDAALKHIETKQSDINKVFGLYRAKLLVLFRTSMGDTNIDLTYQYSGGEIIPSQNPLLDEEFEEARDLKMFWQTDDKEDIAFLENEFSNFKKTNKAGTHAEIILLKEVCFKLLDMKKDRKGKKSTDSSLKQLMNVMEKLLISPNTVNAANSGENLDTFGSWIAVIEKQEPAQWLEGEGKELYNDVEDVEGYFQKYFVRPLRNFILQAKDWNIDDDGLEDDVDLFKDSADGEENNDKSTVLSE